MSSHGPKQKVIVDPTQGYERTDIVIPEIAKWLSALAVFVTASAVIAWVIYLNFVPKSGAIGEASRFSREAKRPPEPTLQALPKVEMRDFRDDEDVKVEGYTWSNKSGGTVNVPLEEAVDKMAQEGRIPSKAQEHGVTDPAKLGEPGARRYDPSLGKADHPPVGNDGMSSPSYPGVAYPKNTPPQPGLK